MAAAATHLSREKPARRRLRGLLAVGGAVLIAAIAVFLLTRPLPPPQVLSTTQLTNDRRGKAPPILSDGSRLYFNTGRFSDAAPYGAPIRGGESFPLAIQLKNARLMDISPDRSELLVRTFAGQGFSPGLLRGPLWIAPVMGGSPRRVGDLSGGDAAWSPDGQRVVFAEERQLDVALSDGTGSQKLITVSGVPSSPRWSPDGKRIRFTLSSDTATGIWEVSPSGSNLHPVFADWRNPHCCGIWTTDGKYFVFQVTSKGVETIWAIREKSGLFKRGSHEPVQLTNGPLNMYGPVPSVDGKRLFVGGHQLRSEIVRYDSKSKAFIPFLSGASAEGLDFSRDGKWVAYVSYPEGTLWRSTVDGEQRLQLTTPPMHVGLPSWSPDGKRIAFMGQYPGQPWRIFTAPADGGALQQITNGKNSTGSDPTWSRDGKSLAVGGTPFPGAHLVIHVLDVTTNQLSVLPRSDGLYSPRWSPDGRYVLALSADSSTLLLFSLQSQTWTELAKASFGNPTWSRDSEYIYIDTLGPEAAFFRVRIRDRKLERVVNLRDVPRTAGTFGPWTGLAPDGSPLFQRDASFDEIYALDWEAP